MNRILEEHLSNRQTLWQQRYKNSRNSFNQSSPNEITLEDLLVSWGVVKKENSSCSISCQPSPPNIYNTSSLPTYQMGELLRKNQGDQQSLWKQHCENAHDSFRQSSPEEITFEDFLVEIGIIQKGHSSCRTSFQPSLPIVYDTSSLQMGLEGTSLERMAHGDHCSPGSVMSGVGPRGIFYKKGRMSMMKIEGHEQMVGDKDHQNLGNIISKAYPTEVCYNVGGRMGITGIRVQQTKVENGGYLGSAMRGISLEDMCFTGVESIRTRIIEEQQLGLRSSMTPISMDGLIIKTKIYNSEGMEGDRNGKRKRKMYKTVEQQMEKKRKDQIKNRESASRSRVRREAYRMELEWMVNRLSDENTGLRSDLKKLGREMDPKPMDQQESINAGETDHALYRCNSCPC